MSSHVIDLDTTEGIVEWVQQLPDENLQAIADRPVDFTNFVLGYAAACELIVRRVKREQS